MNIQARLERIGPILLILALLLGCSRPLDRPLEGAQARPGGGSDLGLIDPPPTLIVPGPSPSVPSAVVVLAPSPSPSPAVAGHNPILSGLVPAPDAQVPAGSVAIGARVSASSDLSDVAVVLDGAAVQPKVTTNDPRNWVIAYNGKLDVGRHEVRLNARDNEGRAGGYRWQFEVEPMAQSLSTSVPAPALATPAPQSRSPGEPTRSPVGPTPLPRRL